MNLRWSPANQRFEAEFVDFHGDLAAVKAAGFRTDGPETGWIWHTHKIAVINKLRDNKPVSGLTITPEALLIYQPMQALEVKNDLVKKQLADFKKGQKKKEVRREQEVIVVNIFKGLTEEKWWLGAEDFPLHVCSTKAFVPPAPPDLLCRVCHDPIYFYEYTEQRICLWCSKMHTI